MINHSKFAHALRDSTGLRALALLGAGAAASALFVAPAMAQDTSASTPSVATPQTTTGDDQAAAPTNDIVVTGTLFRRTNTETASPVTVLTADNLAARGINTAADAVQRLSANGAGTIAQGWNTGSNFATGASAPSLRGLTVQSTLTLFDGQRMAPYPLADDGHRNFVDINTIPDAIIDRIEVLRDGASSTYGADAVAGVINIITKKQIKGVFLNGSAGISEKGDMGEQRLDATVGFGDLNEQGFNVYLNAEYQKSDALFARDRGYPYNTADLSRICNGASPINQCLKNNIQFGTTVNGTTGAVVLNTTLPSTIVPIVAPYNSTGTTRLGTYRLLNTADGCRDLVTTTLPASVAGTTFAPTQCLQDLTHDYSLLFPSQERLGFAGRVTAKINENTQFYASGNYYQTITHAQLSPLAFANQTTPPGAVIYSPVFLPVYVCPTGSFTGANTTNNGCTAANGTLNPNNPFAALGQLARLDARYDRPRKISSKARALRASAGVSGEFGGGFKYTVDATVSEERLDITQENYLIPSRLFQVIAQGTYNFVNPSANSQAIRDFIAPVNKTRSFSNLWQVSATLGKDLFALPGGPLEVAVGVAYRHESITNPSANPQNDSAPYDRYYGVNSVGATGARNVKSAYFEINAPIFDQLELNGSGRYDDYSSGQKNFSPKIGAKFTPIKEFAIRGTFSKGFRIPSFNEAYGLPTTGYITQTVNCTTFAAFCAAHNNNSYATSSYSIGLTATGNPSLKPERSTSFTGGIIVEPIRNVSFTVDYYHIKVKDLIGGVDYSPVPALYYANNGVVNLPGITVRPQIADAAFPNALPLLGFIEYSFQNNDSQTVSGLDFGANIRRNLFANIKWTSNFDASYLIKFEKTIGGSKQRYDGTLSPCDITSCSGSPKWRFNWQNTFEIGDFSLSGTLYYTGGYDYASVDYGGVKGDCANNIGASVVAYYGTNVPVKCRGDATWNFDMTASIKVTEKFKLYADALNVLGIKAPFDPSAAYSIYQYNPAWAQQNLIGRYFRVGAKVNF